MRMAIDGNMYYSTQLRMVPGIAFGVEVKFSAKSLFLVHKIAQLEFLVEWSTLRSV